MKTISINLYTFDELPESVQDKIIYNWRTDDEYFWSGENYDSLKAFCDIFRINIINYEYGYQNYINASTSLDDDILELSGIKLAKHLWNNYKNYLFKPKYYYRNGKMRNSKIQFDNDCILTGYYIDNEILGPIYDFLDKPDNRNFDELLEDCTQSWLSACRKDYDYWMSRECIIDDIKSNDYLFTANGELESSIYQEAA